jgi:arylsulfatase A-like enzyme
LHTLRPHDQVEAFGAHAKPNPDHTLAAFLRARGFTNHAIALPGKEVHPAIVANFDSIDRSLDAMNQDPSGVTSEAVTDRVIQKVTAHLEGTTGPLFVWAHYFDPHAPYVRSAGSPWTFASLMDRYVAEVRRTDHAIGRLATALRSLPRPARTLVFVTADHGEGLGEKGIYYHGAAVNDPGARIPMLAWSPDAAWLRSLRADLPASTPEVAPYLSAVVEGAPFRSSNEAFFTAHVRGGWVYGVYRDGWKVTHHQVFGATELYHLPTDPTESRNRAETDPAKLRDLMERLTGYLRAGESVSVKKLAYAEP